MLSQRYLKALFEGSKRSTIRPGVLRVADRVYIHSRGKIVAVAEVAEVVYKRVSELTEKDALLDGFNSREELVAYLKKRYPGLRDDAMVTIIKFGKVSRLEMPEDAHYGGLTPVEIATLALNKLKLSQREQKVLKAVVETGSIRKAAVKLYGTVEKRGAIRKVLRKVASLLMDGSLDREVKDN
jgi:hypothetical protein